ncbi:serine/threonine-protein kinase [Actinomadura hibisca]|uniref:serine/threonine-protein kinase n=1 Tax=Actinomadura hibisca TaxID=68565 RepID=UPI000830F868|nr:serine/threonine-protein kinase [Actinomadura hibisca]
MTVDTVGPFRVVGELGQGGMGRVLLGAGRDGRLVAVKQVHEEFAEDEAFRARFRREVEASRRVSGAYTAAVVAADTEAATPWLASEFVPGPSLRQVLDDTGPLPEDAARRLAAGLARALLDVHGAGLVHRDLKPSNVLLAEDGVRVIDFGIARAAEEGGQTRITHTGALVGSPAFMSPEQVEGRDPTPASDVFALGATLVTACTGKGPFPGRSAPQMFYAIVHSEPDLGAVPPGLRPVVAACLAKDPAARPTPQQVLQMVGMVAPAARPWPEAVHRLIAGQRAEVARQVAAPVPRMDPTVPGTRPARGRKLAVLSGVALLLVAVGAGVLLLGDKDENGVPSALWVVVPEEVPTPGGTPLSQVSDRYTGKLPDCEQATAAVRIPGGFAPFGKGVANSVFKSGDGTSLHSGCTWTSRSGDKIVLDWQLFSTGKGPGTGAEQAKDRHEGLYLRGRSKREKDVGYAEEVHRLAAEKSLSDNNCVYYVRDVNLTVFLALSGPRFPRGGCDADAHAFAKGAVQAVPR